LNRQDAKDAKRTNSIHRKQLERQESQENKFFYPRINADKQFYPQITQI